MELFLRHYIAGNFPANQNIIKIKRKAKGKGGGGYINKQKYNHEMPSCKTYAIS